MLIGLAVGNANPKLSVSDQMLADAFAALGARVAAPRWNGEPLAAFLDCDAVLLRGTWDYQADPAAFADWLRRLEDAGGRVFNSAALAIWNNDKRHIIELAARGAAVPRTIEVGHAATADMVRELGGDVVVKPAWGGDGVGVRRVDAESVDAAIADILAEAPGRPLMVQPYLPEIAAGEWSLVFIGGEFAHAVLKRPAAGDFRVNSRFGGVRARAEPVGGIIEDAARILDLLPARPLYARIDGVVRAGSLLCTELELTDPGLYFDLAPESAGKLAVATLALLMR